MGLLSFLQRLRGAEQAPAKAPSKAPSADEVQRARTRARQRLIGAVVLLGVGVIGFPLLFETQPRPIPVDIPIEIPRKESAPPLVTPAARHKPAAQASAAMITEKVADAGRDVSPPVPASAPAREAPKTEVKPEPAKAQKAENADNADKPTKTERAEKPEKAEKAEKAEKVDVGRYVVQVGAFSDTGAAREARQKVEKLGLKTYTQVVETDAGKRVRVRVGPFSSRDEADKAAVKIRSAGLPSAILGL